MTGGRVSYSNTLDSTELLLPSAPSWNYSGALPSPRNMLRGATLNNKVLVTGTPIDIHMSQFILQILQFLTQCRRPVLGWQHLHFLWRCAGIWRGVWSLEDHGDHDSEEELPCRFSHQFQLHSGLLYCNWLLKHPLDIFIILWFFIFNFKSDTKVLIFNGWTLLINPWLLIYKEL